MNHDALLRSLPLLEATVEQFNVLRCAASSRHATSHLL